MTDENEARVEEISGVAKLYGRPKTLLEKLAARKWIKHEGDQRPCGITGCDNEGIFIPTATIWGKEDEFHTDRHARVIIPMVLCKAHATQDPSQYVPDADMKARIITLLGVGEDGKPREPDYEGMVIQFFGNHRVRVEYASAEAAKSEGAFQPMYDKKTGKISTSKVA